MFKFAEKVELIAGNHIGYIVSKDSENIGYYKVLLEEFNDVTTSYRDDLISLGYKESYAQIVNTYLENIVNEDGGFLKPKNIVSYKDRENKERIVYIGKVIDTLCYGYLLKKNLKVDYRRLPKTHLHNYTISFIGENVKDLRLVKENIEDNEVQEFLEEKGK